MSWIHKVLSYLQTQRPAFATGAAVVLLIPVAIYVAARTITASLNKALARNKPQKLGPAGVMGLAQVSS